MSTLVGKTLSHYEILEEIGRGGMGTVYRARDRKLEREVALKVLPSELLADPDRKRRFNLEAKAAAQLEHPHIGVVHEIDEEGGTAFIVMELIRGEPLSELIAAGRLSPTRSLGLATEIAEGLARAHEKGILHRDLKPTNVMVTEDGHAKIIDFGLAKLLEPLGPGDSEAETATRSGTATGAMLGTAAYMSPEQARGARLDRRSDIFSLGVMLHEMLSGTRPFRGATRVDTLHAILNAPAAPLGLPSGEDASDLQSIVDKCLAKDLDRRYQGTEDLVADLRAAWRRLESGPLSTPSALSAVWFSRRASVAVLSLLIVLVAGLAGRYGLQASRVRWARNVAMPEVTRLAKEERLQAAFRLARQAERYLPDDHRLQQKIEEMTHVTSIDSEPSGAQAYFADYLDPAAEWELAGTTPIRQTRVPYGLLRWKITREGFEETMTTAWAGGGSLQFTLRAKGTVPPGMVGVPGGLQPWAGGKGYKLDDYWIDRYEVTNAEFKAFVDAGGYKKREFWKEPFVKDNRALSWDEAMAEFRDRTGRPGPSTWALGTFPEGEGDRPVGGVSWYEAAAFATSAGKSLPTIYHWIFASEEETLLFDDMLRLSNFGGAGPLPVGQTRALGTYGTYDMAGNVREWCSNSLADGSTRPLLGGAWTDSVEMFGSGDPTPPIQRSPANGFRCARYTRPPSADVLAPYVWPEPTWHPPVGDAAFRVYKGLYAYPRRDLLLKAEGAEDSIYWRQETVSYDAGYGDERVIAHLYLPKEAKPPYQTVIYFPEGWALALKSSQALEMRWVGFIVRSGRAVLCPVFKGTYERRPSREPENIWEEWTIDWAKDLGRSIDFLGTRPDIDSHRIGYYGFSLGSFVAPVFAAVEPRLKTMILLSGGAPPEKLPPQVDPFNFAPRATIPILMLNGKGDIQLTRASRRILDLLGTPPEHKRMALLEGGHVLARLDDVMREVLDWLDRYLGPVS